MEFHWLNACHLECSCGIPLRVEVYSPFVAGCDGFSAVSGRKKWYPVEVLVLHAYLGKYSNLGKYFRVGISYSVGGSQHHSMAFCSVCISIAVCVSTMHVQSSTWSNYVRMYKHHSTAKSLIACTPNGGISYVSSLYAGSTSDVELTRLSGFLGK